MKNRLTLTTNRTMIWLTACFALTGLAQQNYQDGVRTISNTISDATLGKRIAVIDIADLEGNIRALGRFLAEEVTTALAETKKVKVVERGQLDRILQELKLTASGITDPANIKNFGKLSGANAIVVGTITDLGESVRVVLRVLSTDTGEVITGARAEIAKTAVMDRLWGQILVRAGTVQTTTVTPSTQTSSNTGSRDRVILGESKGLYDTLFRVYGCYSVQNKEYNVTCEIEIIANRDIEEFGLWIVEKSARRSELVLPDASSYLPVSGRFVRDKDTSEPRWNLKPEIATVAYLNFKIEGTFSTAAFFDVGHYEQGCCRSNNGKVRFTNVPIFPKKPW